MLAARKQCLGTIELPARRSFITTSPNVHQDRTLAELFHRLGQQGEVCLVASPTKSRLADMLLLKASPSGSDVDYAPADLLALEVELAQELSKVLARSQR